MRRSNLVLSLLVLATSLVVLAGCVERAPEMSPADRERLREFVGTEAPTPQHVLNVRFESGVTLLGYDLAAERLTPGQAATITWYWHSTRDLDDGWQMFTHVADASGENRLNQDQVGVVRELHPPGRWASGQYIRDVQSVTLPNDWGSDRAIFYLGLWNGDHRLTIQSGPNDGDDRATALSIPVVMPPSAAAPPARPAAPAANVRNPPTTRSARLTGALRIDGRMDEPAWQAARPTTRFVNTIDGEAAELHAGVRTLWDDEKLYVAFEVRDDFVTNALTDRDAHLWEHDAVEIMVDPDGDGRNYFEMQVSPTGAIFDTRYDSRRQPQPFGDVSWNSGLQAAVHVDGTANDDAADTGYTVEIAIPWAAFAQGEPPASRPEADAMWRVNFYVMDERQGGPARSAGWSPTHVSDFHVPDRFGRVVFEGPQQAAAEGAPPGLPQLAPAAAALVRQQIQAGRAGIRNPRAVTGRPEAAPTPAE